MDYRKYVKYKEYGVVQCCYCKASNISFPNIRFHYVQGRIAHGCDNCKNYNN